MRTPLIRFPDIPSSLPAMAHSPLPAWKRQIRDSLQGSLATQAHDLALYDQMRYHCGVDQEGSTTTGKLFRPLLLMGICHLQMANHLVDREQRQQRMKIALIAGVALELIHNFSLAAYPQ